MSIQSLTLVISQKAPRRAEAWRTELRRHLGVENNVVFALGDEPDEPIENIANAITIAAIEAEIEDMNSDDDSVDE